MALSWNVTEIADKNVWRKITAKEYEEHKNSRAMFECPRYEKDGEYFVMKMRCNMMIWALGLNIGIPQITKSNWEVVANRIKLWETFKSPFLYTERKDGTRKASPYKRNEIKKLIGLTTNGSAITSNKFIKLLTKDILI